MNRLLLLLAAIVLVLTLAGAPTLAQAVSKPPAGDIPITNATVITEPGTYYLAGSLSNLDSPVAISIRCSDVVVDGRHHSIDGRSLAGTIGIEIRSPENGTAVTNVSVTNARLSNWGTGLTVSSASSETPGTGVQLTGVRAANNMIGFWLWGPGTLTLLDCTVESNTGAGIIADGVNGHLEAALSNLLVRSNGGPGIAGRLTGFTLDGCRVRDNGADADDGGNGLVVYKGTATVRDCLFEQNRGAGVFFDTSTSGTVTGCRIQYNGFAGIRDAEVAGEGEPLTIYNNYLLNDHNLAVADRAGSWSVPKEIGPNIAGGPFIGGNYWASPNGTGFSETHPDRDGDGFCDEAFVIGTGAVDALPLAMPANLSLGTVPGGVGSPTDPDGLGRYGDVNGNGRKDFADVVLYFTQLSWIAANEPVALFDYNANGRIDFADVVQLFNTL